MTVKLMRIKRGKVNTCLKDVKKVKSFVLGSLDLIFVLRSYDGMTDEGSTRFELTDKQFSQFSLNRKLPCLKNGSSLQIHFCCISKIILLSTKFLLLIITYLFALVQYHYFAEKLFPYNKRKRTSEKNHQKKKGKKRAAHNCGHLINRRATPTSLLLRVSRTGSRPGDPEAGP